MDDRGVHAVGDLVSWRDGHVREPSGDAVEDSDVVITMGRGDACPIFPGRQYLDWQLADPAGQELPAVRAIRDDIEQRVRGLLSTLL